MKFKYLLISLAALAVMFSGCKKDSATTPTLSGSLTISSVPSYVNIGESYVISARGGYRGTDKADSLLGFRMYDPFTASYDTLRKESDPATKPAKGVITIKDTLGSFSITVYAFATGYYGISASRSFVVVDPSLDNGSLTKHPFGTGITSKEKIGDKDYYTITGGGKTWMAQNLANDSYGRPYLNSAAVSGIFGRFYTFEEAKVACPAGWRLPTDEEFVAFAGKGKAMEDIKDVAGDFRCEIRFNGTEMWQNRGKYYPRSNVSLFTALPVGYSEVSDESATFKSYGNCAVIWTSTEASDGMAIAREIYKSQNDIYAVALPKTGVGASVRCVKE